MAPFLIALVLLVCAAALPPTLFADSVTYSFDSAASAQHYLKLLKPLADYVAAREAAFTYTFGCSSRDGASVLLLERRGSGGARWASLEQQRTRHVSSAVAAWNASTGAITGKVHADWSEGADGVFVGASASAARASGFADSVTYSFDSAASAQHYLKLLKPLADYVAAREVAFTYTFRPFVYDGASVLLLERFVDQAAHDGPHSTAAHATYLRPWRRGTRARGHYGQGACRLERNRSQVLQR